MLRRFSSLFVFICSIAALLVSPLAGVSLACPVDACPGQITTPTQGSTLSGSSVTFNWTAGAGTAYWLDVGSTAGGNNYYQSGNLGNVLTTTVAGLPLNGTKVYATLYSLISGQWASLAYTYTAAAGGVLTTPVPGSTLTSGTVTFNWTVGSGTAYWLDVGSTAGGDRKSVV